MPEYPDSDDKPRQLPLNVEAWLPVPVPARYDKRHAVMVRWRCPNCGQHYFAAPDEDPPDMCAYCHDMTTWQRLS